MPDSSGVPSGVFIGGAPSRYVDYTGNGGAGTGGSGHGSGGNYLAPAAVDVNPETR